MSSKYITLENFDQNSTKDPIINSPRSLEACRRQGILPEDLVTRNLEEIKDIYGEKTVDKHSLDVRAQHYETRRKEKLKIVTQERILVIEDEKNGIWSVDKESRANNLLSSRKGGESSTMIEREKKQLEKIKLKQKKEIEQLMDYEIKMAEIRNQNEKKLRQGKDREREREKEMVLKRKEAEEIRLKKELEKQKKIEEEQELMRQQEIQRAEKENEKIKQEREAELLRQKEAKKREDERKLKQEEFKKKSEEFAVSQAQLMEKKRLEMEEKDRIRKEALAKQSKEKAIEILEHRKMHEAKLLAAKEKTEAEIERIRNDFLKKELLNEDKRKMFEKERERRREESRKKAEEKNRLIQKVLEENTKIQENYKLDYYRAQAEVEGRKKELAKMKEEETQKRKEQDAEKEKQRLKVRENNESMIEGKKNEILDKLKIQDDKIRKAKASRDDELREKHNLEIIKRYERMDNVRRIQRIQEYKKLKYLEDIEHEDLIARMLMSEKEQLMENRKLLRKDIDSSKQSILEKFEKIKRGKLDPLVLSEEFGIKKDFKSLTYMAENSTSDELEKNQAPSLLRPKNARKLNKLKAEPPGSSNLNQTAPVRASLNTDARIESFLNGRSKSGINEKEIKEMIEDLKLKQNHEMLIVLQEEQESESNRDEAYAKTLNEKERKKMEKVFLLERQRAKARINDLALKHERIMNDLLNKYGVAL